MIQYFILKVELNNDCYVNYTLCLFRRDLRLNDNLLIKKAIDLSLEVIFLYILDEDQDPKLGSASMWYLYYSLSSFSKDVDHILRSRLLLRKDGVIKILDEFFSKHKISNFVFSEGFGSYFVALDAKIQSLCEDKGVKFFRINNSSLLNFEDIHRDPYYRVFTPFWKNYVLKNTDLIRCFDYNLSDLRLKNVSSLKSDNLDSWNLLPKKPNWARDFYWAIGENEALKKWNNFLTNDIFFYKEKRNFPFEENGVSKLSPNLAFGEISPWRIFFDCQRILKDGLSVSKSESVECFLSEIGWREFSYYLIKNNPEMQVKNFNEKFDSFEWLYNEELFIRWCSGKTGYPIVDASMKQLWKTGWMHNRSRMIVASFLTKNLGIDWRFGERYFWDTLVDADIASNSCSWQWVAGSGADAAPYFRIFNASLQSKKFDSDCIFIRKYLTQLKEIDKKYIHEPWLISGEMIKDIEYFPVVVDLKESSVRALERYRIMNASFKNSSTK